MIKKIVFMLQKMKSVYQFGLLIGMLVALYFAIGHNSLIATFGYLAIAGLAGCFKPYFHFLYKN